MALELKEKGNDYYKQYQYALALQCYSQALDIEPENITLLSNRANTNFQLGEFMLSEQDAKRALELDSGHVKSHWRLAEIYSVTNKQELSLQSYKAAHELNPSNRKIAEAYTRMINIVRNLRNPKPNYLAGLSGVPSRNLSEFMTHYQGMNNYFASPYGPTSSGPEHVNEDGRQFRYDLDDLEALFKELSNGSYIHSYEVFRLIKQTGEIINPYKSCEKFSFKSNLFIVGDIHGSLPDFKRLFDTHVRLDTFDKSDDQLLVLGDYVDRGQNGHQVILFLAALKCKYPSRVHLIRGNHETPQMNSFFGYQAQVDNAYGSKSGVFAFMTQFFSNLPLCYFIEDAANEKYFACHGGPPVNTPQFPETIPAKAIEPQDEISQQLLWNDPCKDDSLGCRPSHRGIGVVFGKDMCEEFNTRNGIKTVFRGHEVVFETGGIKNEFNNNSLYTVFSSSNYMGQGNYGGILRIKSGSDQKEVIKLM